MNRSRDILLKTSLFISAARLTEKTVSSGIDRNLKSGLLHWKTADFEEEDMCRIVMG
jgi:hypothetical protein